MDRTILLVPALLALLSDAVSHPSCWVLLAIRVVGGNRLCASSLSYSSWVVILSWQSYSFKAGLLGCGPCAPRPEYSEPSTLSVLWPEC